ncbi:hypothetical protein M514_14767 [Trichuris suis]|uniref:Uncharacterized protein n=1 Tax=Trichuris suis TaxID=68888 RepID=A0A085NTR7_9BILA|nr:hypothetical protein M514_14767 [Trichuris suis]
MWSLLERRNKEGNGIRRSILDSYLAEFTWRRKFGKDDGAFHNILQEIAAVFSSRPTDGRFHASMFPVLITIDAYAPFLSNEATSGNMVIACGVNVNRKYIYFGADISNCARCRRKTKIILT